ncbi:hypothetical protein FF38_00632 [Lucilia cuprina]|uniref:DUF4704 domain-containing protein n=1 Tax=Lucilia cuprina TaxID=7375 RepID=A0A0L0CDR6_LUCCU|nr:hypothetical protein FF38_00632 [Lucilia cuprina]
MDNKKDIYNLWVQYTTKNEESYFREFIERFVSIWQSQLSLDFNSEQCPYWHEVKPDSGPHLGRLPDELLPAIGKFIIVASDSCQNGEISEETIRQIAILVDCLIIVCRHFDNILAIIKYEYKSNLIAILTNVFQQVSHLFRSFAQFLEVMYDPYLTWRSFLRNNFADYKKLPYKPHSVHVEIIPFIYDCFQHNDITKYPDIGESLIHTLGAIICGSQKTLAAINLKNLKNTGDGVHTCDNLRNGMRAICPATVSVLIKILSQWETNNNLRIVTLRCCALMIIVLQKSSPEERQIDLVTLIKLYCDVLDELLKTEIFQRLTVDTFDIGSDDNDPNYDQTIDVNALDSSVDNISVFLADVQSSSYICEAIEETNLVDILISIPKYVKCWNLNYAQLLMKVLKALAFITRNSLRITEHIRYYDKVGKLFMGLMEVGLPSVGLLEAAIELAYNAEMGLIVLPEVLTKLIEWLPEMDVREQTYLSEKILKACTDNYGTKSIACESRIIKSICLCLHRYEKLSDQCIQNYIKLIEELSKLSIIPIELKSIFSLLRKESKFPHSKQLLQTLVSVSLQSLTSTNLCSQYFNFCEPGDGIVVTDIKNWSMSGAYGFIFHILLRLDKPSDGKSKTDNQGEQEQRPNCRRMLLNLRTGSNTGFEIFIQNNGNIVVAALTKREYLTSSVASTTLMDGQWHYVTVAITPPKRPFSYSQINVYIDFMQKISATLKVQAINEPFIYCSVGSALQEIKPTGTATGGHSNTSVMPRSSSQDTNQSYKGMLPSLLERTLSTNVSNYFTLPLRTQSTSFDPNVKNFPVGMQETVFGEQKCLYGQIGGVLLAEPTTSLKTIFDAGIHFSSIFSQDNDILELTSRFVFCYSPAAYTHNTCLDLIPSGRYMGLVQAQHCHIVKIRDTINSVGGIQAILPILHRIIKENNSEFSLAAVAADSAEESTEPLKTPITEEFADWEVLSSNSYTEWKMIQFPIASFMCFLRYLTHEHDNNQENLLNSECLSIIGMMLQKCPAKIFDVNALMATHLFMESVQGHKSSTGQSNLPLLDDLYTSIAFNFDIWVHMPFQITLGHVQYLGAMIKNDRKYFRKKFGIQFFLDVIRQHYGTPESITPEDAKTIRSTIFAIIRFYLQKDVNIKEIGSIIAFLASVKQEHVLIEFLDMMTMHIKGKNCRDQLILLLHEPQTANLIYNYFMDKNNSCELQEAAIRFISSLLSTSRVQAKYKQIMRLHDATTDASLFPGLFSYTIPMQLSSTIIFHMLDEMLNTEVDYCGLLFLVHHVSSCELPVKLEVAKRLLQCTFTKHNSPQAIAKQPGWQESIARLLIRRPIENVKPDEEKRKSFGINLDVLLEDENKFDSQGDLINFCEQQMEIDHPEHSDGGLILNEIHASVSEAANVLESEFKELAESVSGVVVENVSSVFSVIRQTTHDLQDTFESLTLGSSTENIDTSSLKERADSISSESSTPSPRGVAKKADSIESNLEFSSEADVDSEEQLVYLVSNILFTVFWRGVPNDHPECWKERGQVLGCINLLALNNELMASHLSLRLRILEMAVQASLFDLAEHGNQTLINQENASHILRMIYDLVVLGSNEDDTKKCSTKLLDGVLALLDALMIFQSDSSDDWSDMIRLCLGLLLKCSHHPNPGVVAMATAKLHAILQSRTTENPSELAYLLFSINKALDNAIEVGNPEEYSFLMPVMKALIEKCRNAFNLESVLPDLPPTSSGPVFFNDFQMYSTSKKWKNFMERIVQPLYDSYQREVEINLWEPINRYWAECYEACKIASKKRSTFQSENRTLFQKKIVIPWKVRQVEETTRLNAAALQHKRKCSHIKKKWKCAKRFLYGPRGPWFTG